MDPFQFYPRENVRVLEREREDARIADGWSPDRRELRELVGRLRDRYGRRRLFRVEDVREVVREMRVQDPSLTVLRMAPRTVERPEHLPAHRVRRIEVIDLTCEEEI